MNIPICYNTNGLQNLSMPLAIKAVAENGYDGIELSLSKNRLCPGVTSKKELQDIKHVLSDHGIPPVCLATGADTLLSDVRFEPSLISENPAGRQRRIDLIRGAMDFAALLAVPVLNLASGILPQGTSREEARDRLCAGLLACLAHSDNVTLALEPEPGMLIETTIHGLDILNTLNHPRLMLNLDIGHAYCAETNLIEAIQRALPHTRHTHIEDIRNRIHHHEIPGTGDIDFKEVFQAFRDSQYAHCVSVELYNHNDVWQQALAQSRAYLRDLVARL